MLSFVIILAALVVCLLIYPVARIPLAPITSNSSISEYRFEEYMSKEDVLEQAFVAQWQRISSVTVICSAADDTNKGIIYFDFYDKNHKHLDQVTYPLNKMEGWQPTQVPMGVSVPKGELCYLAIRTEGYGDQPVLFLSSDPSMKAPEVGTLTFNGVERDSTLSLDFEYVRYLDSYTEAVPFYGIVIIIVAILVELINLPMQIRKRKSVSKASARRMSLQILCSRMNQRLYIKYIKRSTKNDAGHLPCIARK